MQEFSLLAETLKEKLANAPDPNALPEGFVRKTIMTPHGEMNVIVPSGNDKASGDTLQSMMDNAVKIDIDESGNVETYSDPNASKFRPGTGQIKRAKPQLTTGQRKRLEGGEDIITDPVNLAPSESTIANFEQARTQAVISTIAANAESAEKIEESQKKYSVSSIAELGRGACCTGGLCGTVVAASITAPVFPDSTPVVSVIPWVVSRGDEPLSLVEAEVAPEEKRPASFWEKVIGLFK